MKEYLQLLTQKGFSECTIRSYKSELTNFEKFKGDTPFSKKLVRQFTADLLREKYKISSVRMKVSRLRTYYRYLKKNGLIEVNYFDLILLPKKETQKMFFRTNNLDQLLIHKTEQDYISIRNKAIITLFCLSGLRRFELTNLDENCIDFETKTITVLQGKGKKDRLVPLHDSMIISLQEYIKIKQEKFENIDGLFLSERGKKLSYAMIYYIVVTALKDTDLHKKSPHVLRHYFATSLHEKGVDTLSISALMGHDSIQSTEVYTHVKLFNLQKEYSKNFPQEIFS
jgi:integrase/recombinase XerC